MDRPYRNTAINSFPTHDPRSLHAPFLNSEPSADADLQAGTEPNSKLHPGVVFLARTAVHPIARNLVYPALKNLGGVMAITGAVTDLLKESGPVAIWVGLGLFGATTLLTSSLFYRTEYLGRHLAASIGDAAAGLPLLIIDFAQAYTCPPSQRLYNPLRTRPRAVSISEDITAGQVEELRRVSAQSKSGVPAG